MPSTAEAAHGAAKSLLDALTDDQLARYGEIARDQASAELSRWWLQALLVLGAVVAFGWAIVGWGASGMEADGFGRPVALALGIGMVLAYWPYRRVKNWTLWNGHCKAVAAEQTRRLNSKTSQPGGAKPHGGG